MNVRMRLSADETKARIVATAEEHFRRVGYAKTAVADIAAALGMSPANVYRFFPSKSAINDAICQRLMAQCHALAETIVCGEGSATERLRRLVLAVHRNNKANLTNEHRLHDMVEAAMAENWPAIEAHICHMESVFAGLIREGIAAGEFRPVDPETYAEAAFDACICVFHPTLIAQCAHKDQEAQAMRLADFVIAALVRPDVAPQRT